MAAAQPGMTIPLGQHSEPDARFSLRACILPNAPASYKSPRKGAD